MGAGHGGAVFGVKVGFALLQSPSTLENMNAYIYVKFTRNLRRDPPWRPFLFSLFLIAPARAGRRVDEPRAPLVVPGRTEPCGGELFDHDHGHEHEHDAHSGGR